MSVRLEMLQVARLAPKVLGDSVELIRGFLLRQLNADGGFRDRTGRSDLYYTVFGLEALMAIQADVPWEPTAAFLEGFGTGDGLDLVHLCCLARCRATLTQMAQIGQGARGAGAGAGPVAGRAPIVGGDVEGWAKQVAGRLEAFRASDGGYHPTRGAAWSTVYASFLAAAAWQDLGLEIPEGRRLTEAVVALRTPDGAWANERRVPAGATNSTAAAVTLLRNLSGPVDPGVGDWLMARRHAQGGFVAAPGAPIPDLLSTATALHALSGLQRSLAEVREPCLDFVDTLWTNEGAFHGHWDDPQLDVEYTYYGLLALGHLSLA